MKSISEKLSKERYKVYIAQKLSTTQRYPVGIAKNINGILRKRFFRKKYREQLRMCLLGVKLKKMRQFIHDGKFVFSNNSYHRYVIYVYLLLYRLQYIINILNDSFLKANSKVICFHLYYLYLFLYLNPFMIEIYA